MNRLRLKWDECSHTLCGIDLGLDFERRRLGWVRMALWMVITPALLGAVSSKGTVWFNNLRLGISLVVWKAHSISDIRYCTFGEFVNTKDKHTVEQYLGIV